MLRFQKLLKSKSATLGWCLLLLSLSPRVLAASSLDDDRVRVLLIGDSHSTTGDQFVSGDEEGLSFADQLELDLNATHEVIAIACPGASMLDWTLETPGYFCPPFEEILPEGLFTTFAEPELPADIVTILLGTNDSIGWFEPAPVTGEAYAEALDRLLATLRLGGAETIVLMTPPDQPFNDGDRERLLDYRDTIFDRCTHSEELVCGPDLFTLLDLETDFASDNLHPNAAGHLKIATALGETILQIPEPPALSLSMVTLTSLALLGMGRRQRGACPRGDP